MEESDTGDGGVTPQDERVTDSLISVLYVDDDADAWDSLSTYVAGSDGVTIERVRDPSIARSMVGQHGIDVIIVEATVPSDGDDPFLGAADSYCRL